jgi:hypothetical protein
MFQFLFAKYIRPDYYKNNEIKEIFPIPFYYLLYYTIIAPDLNSVQEFQLLGLK